ncbi:hypothetical protein HYY71_03035 [Candidatus Woesearchaeota archaeon]|nr:hypothetical protein [Candidatus Woesearchaeota archaeon]
MFSKLDIKARIIRKLARWQKWSGSHTENALKGLPKHIVGEKIVKDALKELVKDEWMIPVRKTGEVHYYLNSKKTDDILQFYEKYCKNLNE